MFWKCICNECIKIAAKPRSYIGLGAITLLVAVIPIRYENGWTVLSFLYNRFI